MSESLYGTWKLVSFTQRVAATGETTEIFGSSPSGFLSYSRDGRMNAILVKDKRPRPVDMANVTSEERAELFSSMYAYAGTFTVDGDTVTHIMSTSLGTRIGLGPISYATSDLKATSFISPRTPIERT